MVLRPIAGLAVMTLLGGAFTTGMLAGVGAVGAACAARKAMKARASWRDDKSEPPKSAGVDDPLA